MHTHLTRALAVERRRDLLDQADRARRASPARRWTRRGALAAIVPAAFAALALPAQADAAFATVSTGADGVPKLSIQDGNGGRDNRIVLSQLADGRLQVFDTGLVQTPGPGCVAGPADSMLCTGASRIQVELFGGNDTLSTTTSLPTFFDGSTGNDTLFAGTGPSTSQVGFSGGAGRDRVQYSGAGRGVSITKDRRDNDGRIGIDRDNIGPDVEEMMGSTHDDSLNGSPGNFNERFFGLTGDDVMNGGPGLDVFTMEAQADGADRIFGGDGVDTVEYLQRTRPVTINLSDGGADDGEAGEGDELRQIEQAATGAGDDTLKANPASTTGVVFQAGSGVDTITGTDAADTIFALSGATDRIDARGGADVIQTRDGEADSLACGQGIDTVFSDSPSLDLQSGCEKVDSVGVLRLADRSVVARAGTTTPMGVAWTRPRASRQLARVVVRLRDGEQPVGEIAIAARRGTMTDEGAIALVRSRSRVKRAERTVRAELGVRLDASLAGRRLTLDVEATDVRGRRQVERAAGTLRVAD